MYQVDRANNLTNWQVSINLPLGLLGLHETLQNADNLVESGQVDPQIRGDLGLISSKLGVEIFTVWAGAHGSTEDGLDQEAVVRLQGRAVCVSEGVGKLLRLLGHVGAEGEAGKVETTVMEDPQLVVKVFIFYFF